MAARTTRDGQERAYIFRAGGLQVSRAGEQIIQDRKQAIAFEEGLEACQELEVKLHVPPLAAPHLLLQCVHHLGENMVYKLGFCGVCDEDDGGDEGRLEWLLNLQLQDQVNKDLAKILILVVVANHEGDGLDLLGPAPQWRLGDSEELSSDSDVQRSIVGASPLVSAVVSVIII